MLFSNQTIGDFFEQQAAREPDREFIVYPDRNLRFTYGEFNQRVDELAKGLLALGLCKGDHLGIWANNVPDWLTLMFATAKIGVVLVTANTFYKRHEVEYVIGNSDMRALALIEHFRDSNYLGIMYDLVPEMRNGGGQPIHSARFPNLQRVIFLGEERHRGVCTIEEVLRLGRELPEADYRHARQLASDCHDVISMQYTSGTTGFPKGVMLSHHNILNNGYYIGRCQRFTSEDRLCLPVPLFHCFGTVLGVLAILTHGATLVVIEQFDPLVVLAAVQKERCTALYGVPSMFIAELEHPMFGMFDLSSLRTGIMAGSPCPAETMKQVMNRMHLPEITIAYGLTEAAPVFTQTSVDDPLERRISTVGRALPHIEVKIIDPATGDEVPTGRPGEICCRGYNIMKGYYNMPEETAAIIDEDGWLHSGDLAVVDEEGYYRITGRIKDMIIRRGENIYPREIEEFLHSMPEIEQVQVIGIPDRRFGEVVGAFVVPRNGAPLTEEAVRDFARARIARYKVPKHVFLVDHLPMTASGKVQKYKLRRMARERLGIQTADWDLQPDLEPTVRLNMDLCKACGLCIRYCPKQLLRKSDVINSLGYEATEYIGHGCTGCGTCYYVCPEPGVITVVRAAGVKSR